MPQEIEIFSPPRKQYGPKVSPVVVKGSGIESLKEFLKKSEKKNRNSKSQILQCEGCQKSYSPRKLLKHLSLDDQNCRKYYSDEEIDNIRIQLPIPNGINKPKPKISF